ncbi:hypothetical protein HDU91_001271 [Kappamyces sp. JEL0680]|nr:hypothetical protein HDU91_001271 [Kappamyces sp. JEL0680]
MDIINRASTCYETTSSCSGRVAVFAEKKIMEQSGQECGPKTLPGFWLFVSHEKVDESSDLLQLLFGSKSVAFCTNGNALDAAFQAMQPIYFKFEPFILHVSSPDADRGQALLNVVFECGYRTSGLVNGKKRCMVQIKDTLKIDAPIGFYDASGDQVHLIVDSSYLGLLVSLSNAKFRENECRMAKLLKGLSRFLIQ